MNAPNCPYCGCPATLVPSRELYPTRPDLQGRLYWRCDRCDAHVGCHKGGCEPMGPLADRKLRQARIAAHQAFDHLWKSGGISRSQAYGNLSVLLKIPPEACHIGQFDLERCREVLRLYGDGRLP